MAFQTLEAVREYAIKCAIKNGAARHLAEDLAQGVVLDVLRFKREPADISKRWIGIRVAGRKSDEWQQWGHVVPVGLPCEEDDDETPSALTRQPDPSPLQDEDTPPDPEPHPALAMLGPALADLKPKQREAVLLWVTVGFEEGVRRLGINRGTFHCRVQSALETLRTLVVPTQTFPTVTR